MAPHSETSAPAPKPSGISRGWRIVLVASLAANLLIIGAVAGAVLSDGPRGGSDRMARDLGLGPFERALSREEKRALRRELRGDRAALMDSGRVLRGSFRDAIEALRADPFDAERLTVALGANRAAISDLQEKGHRAFAAHVADMSAADRAALATRVEEALPRRRQLKSE